jgi:hypothetical protein
MKNKSIIERTFLYSWPVAIVVSVVIYLISGNFDYMVSYIIGVASVLFMQSINYRVMKNLYKNYPELIKSRTVILYFVRFIFYGLILYICIKDPEWNVFYAFGGILTYRIVLHPTALIMSKKGDEKDNEL